MNGIKEHKPVLIVIAGPNGSGKTSVTSKLLHHEWMGDAIYVNPDIVAQEKFGDWNSPDAIMQSVKYCEELREKSIANCLNASRYADKTYLYDNSIDNHEVTPLCRMNFGELAKQYEDDLPEWARLILDV